MNITAKEKCDDLMAKFESHVQIWDCTNDMPLKENHAKKCALICIDEMIKSHNNIYENFILQDKTWRFFLEVKTEIEKL